MPQHAGRSVQFHERLSEQEGAALRPVYFVSVKPLLAGWDMVLRRGASPADPAILRMTKPVRLFRDKGAEVAFKVPSESLVMSSKCTRYVDAASYEPTPERSCVWLMIVSYWLLPAISRADSLWLLQGVEKRWCSQR